MGLGARVKGLMSAVPLEAVESMEIKRLLAGKKLIVGVNGEEIHARGRRGCQRERDRGAFDSLRATT